MKAIIHFNHKTHHSFRPIEDSTDNVVSDIDTSISLRLKAIVARILPPIPFHAWTHSSKKAKRFMIDLKAENALKRECELYEIEKECGCFSDSLQAILSYVPQLIKCARDLSDQMRKDVSKETIERFLRRERKKMNRLVGQKIMNLHGERRQSEFIKKLSAIDEDVYHYFTSIYVFKRDQVKNRPWYQLASLAYCISFLKAIEEYSERPFSVDYTYGSDVGHVSSKASSFSLTTEAKLLDDLYEALSSYFPTDDLTSSAMMGGLSNRRYSLEDEHYIRDRFENAKNLAFSECRTMIEPVRESISTFIEEIHPLLSGIQQHMQRDVKELQRAIQEASGAAMVFTEPFIRNTLPEKWPIVVKGFAYGDELVIGADDDSLHMVNVSSTVLISALTEKQIRDGVRKGFIQMEITTPSGEIQEFGTDEDSTLIALREYQHALKCYRNNEAVRTSLKHTKIYFQKRLIDFLTLKKIYMSRMCVMTDSWLSTVCCAATTFSYPGLKALLEIKEIKISKPFHIAKMNTSHIQ